MLGSRPSQPVDHCLGHASASFVSAWRLFAGSPFQGRPSSIWLKCASGLPSPGLACGLRGDLQPFRPLSRTCGSILVGGQRASIRISGNATSRSTESPTKWRPTLETTERLAT